MIEQKIQLNANQNLRLLSFDLGRTIILFTVLQDKCFSTHIKGICI